MLAAPANERVFDFGKVAEVIQDEGLDACLPVRLYFVLRTLYFALVHPR